MRFYTSLCSFLIVASTSVGAVDLGEPISTILSDLGRGGASVLADFRSETGLAASTPIRTFLRPEFYNAYVRPRRSSWSGDGPFFRQQHGWDKDIAFALGRRHLAFDMSPAEIAAYERNDPTGPLFYPLDSIVVTHPSGRKISLRPFADRGMHLIKDFLRLYDEEMQLPEGRRFLHKHKADLTIVAAVKDAIDRRLADQGVDPDAPVGARGLDEAAIVRRFLLRLKANEGNAEVRRACDVVLSRLPPAAPSSKE